MASACSMTERCHRLLLSTALSLLLLAAFAMPARAEGPSASANLRYLTISDEINDARTETDTFLQNYYLSLERPINPVFSYQLYLRANTNDTKLTLPSGSETTTRRLSVEPTFDFFMKNPMYNLNIGYRRTEARNSATLTGKDRETTDYIYSRLNLTFDQYPLFTFLADRSKQSGHKGALPIERTYTTYSGTSSYNAGYKGLSFMYNAMYLHTDEERPQSAVNSSVADKFAGTYNFGYNRSFINNRLTLNSSYQGTYSSNKTVQTAAITQTIVTPPFTPLFGGHAVGTTVKPSVDVLAAQPALTDGNLAGAIASVDLFAQQYHNIGISVPSFNVVDRLYVYVSANLSAGENNLGCGAGCASNWEVYRTTNNIPLTTWTRVNLKEANLVSHDAINNIYYYELVFTAPQSDMYFKAVNRVTAAPSDPSVTSVVVTEIEARGSETVAAGRERTDKTTVFTQGFNLGVVARPMPRLTWDFQYSINRTDLNPDSLTSSLGGVFGNIFSGRVDDNGDKFLSNVIRNYSTSLTWLTHRLLTTTARVNRSELFDNLGITDIAMNTYALTLNARPLPSIDSALTVSRTETSSAGIQSNTNDSAILSISSKLYRDVTLTTDLGLNRTTNHTTGLKTNSEFITGDIYALLNPKLSANVRFGLRWSDSEGVRSDSQEGELSLLYRPGRFISINGILRAQSISGKLKLKQGIVVDWIAYRALRFGINYQHTTDDETGLKEDLLNAYSIWKMTRFMDLQLSYNLLNKKDDKLKQLTHSLGLNLNCRF